MVDCALAKLIAIGKIIASDIFVYQRAIEDAIDLLLMRSRAESQLASMATSIELLKDLKVTWMESEQRNVLECSVSNDFDNALKINDLAYSRGSAAVRKITFTFFANGFGCKLYLVNLFLRESSHVESMYFNFLSVFQVQIDKLVMQPGIYAVTGANGSGKSTLFRLIMSCNTNKKSIDLASSISIDKIGSVLMPSSDVVEISQNFYWPLFTRPVDWIYQTHLNTDVMSDFKREQMITRVEEELRSLHFYQEDQTGNGSGTTNAPAAKTTSLLRSDLTEVKEDWFGDLSGGQKSKVELVRKVS